MLSRDRVDNQGVEHVKCAAYRKFRVGTKKHNTSPRQECGDRGSETVPVKTLVLIQR